MTTLTVNAQGELIFRKVVVKHLGVGRRPKVRLDPTPHGASRPDGCGHDSVPPAAWADLSGVERPN